MARRPRPAPTAAGLKRRAPTTPAMAGGQDAPRFKFSDEPRPPVRELLEVAKRALGAGDAGGVALAFTLAIDERAREALAVCLAAHAICEELTRTAAGQMLLVHVRAYSHAYELYAAAFRAGSPAARALKAHGVEVRADDARQSNLITLLGRVLPLNDREAERALAAFVVAESAALGKEELTKQVAAMGVLPALEAVCEAGLFSDKVDLDCARGRAAKQCFIGQLKPTVDALQAHRFFSRGFGRYGIDVDMSWLAQRVRRAYGSAAAALAAMDQWEAGRRTAATFHGHSGRDWRPVRRELETMKPTLIKSARTRRAADAATASDAD